MLKALPSIRDIFKLQKRVLVHKIKCRDIGVSQTRGKRGKLGLSAKCYLFPMRRAFDGALCNYTFMFIRCSHIYTQKNKKMSLLYFDLCYVDNSNVFTLKDVINYRYNTNTRSRSTPAIKGQFLSVQIFER